MLAIVASIGLATTGFGSAFAQNPNTDDPNLFGEGASFLGGANGDHASDPSGDGVGNPGGNAGGDEPRSGIGNANQEILNGEDGGKPIDGISKHPSELVKELCSGGSPLCPP